MYEVYPMIEAGDKEVDIVKKAVTAANAIWQLEKELQNKHGIKAESWDGEERLSEGVG